MTGFQSIEELAKLIAEGTSEQNIGSVKPKLLESADLILQGSDLETVRRLRSEHEGLLFDAIRRLSVADQKDLLRKWNPHRRPSADESRDRSFTKELIGLADGALEPAASPRFDPKDTETHTVVWVSYIALASGILLLAGALYALSVRVILVYPNAWAPAAPIAAFGCLALAAGTFLILRTLRQLRGRWRALDAGAPDLSRRRSFDDFGIILAIWLWAFPFAVVAAVVIAVAVFTGSFPSVAPK